MFKKLSICSLFFLLFLCSTIYTQIPELIGTIESDTNLTLFGSTIVPLGDQNGDGFDDILIWGFQFSAFIYFGGYPFDTQYEYRIDSVNGRINAFDLNNDLCKDILIPGRSKDNWKLKLFYGGDLLDTISDAKFGNDTLYALGYTVLTNDVNSDGISELFSYFNEHLSVVMYNLNPPFDSIPDLELTPPNLTRSEYANFGEGITSDDFNGDGKSDLALGLQYRGNDSLNGQVFLYWGGADFDSLPDMIITRPGDYEWGFERFGVILENLKDINGDGYADFAATGEITAYDTLHFIYFGGPQIDSIPDIILNDFSNNIRSARDINNDGYNDFITSLNNPFDGGYVNLYFGGPTVDNIPDVTISEIQFPELQWNFGHEISGVGDINGDGIDDFAISAEKFDSVYRRGVVYIFAGWDSTATDVEYEYYPQLPTNFQLNQNYPNPFNPSTTIEFAIPHKEYVTLAVYNILGQKVKTLIQKDLLAGSYSFKWDGTNDKDINVSSGVYLYKLESSDFSESRTMLLLK